MSHLADFLKGDARQIRADSERRKAEKLDWQRATQELVNQAIRWVTDSDPENVIMYNRKDHPFVDYDVGGDYVLKGVTFGLGDAAVRLVPSTLPVVGTIQVPGEERRRKIAGRVEFDNGTDRIPLYRVKDEDRDIWLWWTHGGVGRPFDKESFETVVVDLLQ